MNSVEAYVMKIISEKPVFKYNKYWIDVEYDCYGSISQTELMFNSLEEALDVKVGYKFLT